MSTTTLDSQHSANTNRMHALFAHFDFSKQPAATPLDHVLHELLAPYLTNESGVDGLAA